jgi:hypothetical protein
LENTCSELLDLCLRGETWPRGLLVRASAEDQGRAFLRIVVERLGDLFEPRLCEVYERLFREAVEIAAPELIPRLRPTGPPPRLVHRPPRVYVLSRVTLGADVAVTSVLMDAAKRAFPGAPIVFVGPRKNYELFENDPRIAHCEAPYARSGSLRERLEASARLWFEDGLVLDPDSRLTQLGLIQVCPLERYFHFNSRGYGGEGSDPLPSLAARWCEETLEVAGACPFIAPLPAQGDPAGITVSLGVGENPAKRFDDAFERELLDLLESTGRSVLVDTGGSPEERERVLRAVRPGMRTHTGAFAPFAAQIAVSQLFIGYDSAAGHVASACGVPLVSIAHGFASDRMAARWRPRGNVLSGSAVAVLNQIREVLRS